MVDFAPREFLATGSEVKKSFNGFFPIGTEKDAEEFWRMPGAKALTVAYMTADEDLFTTKIEVVSDALSTFRLGLGVTVASASTEGEDQTNGTETANDSLDLQTATIGRLLEDGGTINVSVSYPFQYFQSTSDKDRLRGLTCVILKTTGGFDTPRAGDILETPRLSGSVGFEATALRISSSGAIGLEVGLKGTKYIFNNEFRENLGFDKNSGGLFNFRVGVILFRQTRLGVSIPFGESRLFEDRVNPRAYIQQNVQL